MTTTNHIELTKEILIILQKYRTYKYAASNVLSSMESRLDNRKYMEVEAVHLANLIQKEADKLAVKAIQQEIDNHDN